jgi:hypothetical protein
MLAGIEFQPAVFVSRYQPAFQRIELNNCLLHKISMTPKTLAWCGF